MIPNSLHRLQTTRSWDYLGLSSHSPSNVLNNSNMGNGVIIGVLDTGSLESLPHSISPLFISLMQRIKISHLMEQEYGQNLKPSVMKDLNLSHLAGRVFANLEINSMPRPIVTEKSLEPVGSLMDFLQSMDSH